VELTYVGRSTCAGCHAAEVEAFTGSDHDMAMDHATSETVLGDFADASVVRDGVETRFSTRGGDFFVTTDGPDGTPDEYQVLYTFGHDPLQQYLVELEPGRVQRLPWSWDSRSASEGGQRWFHTYGDQPIESGDILHWTRSSQNWNRMCADCHSTNLRKSYDAESDSYATTWSEIDVSCEACHGPASRHLEWAERSGPGVTPPANRGFPVGLTAADNGTWVREGDAPTARRSQPRTDPTPIETCARCHSHRTPIAEYVAGAPFADTYRLSLPREPLYHSDGQVKEEVFVYGSFLQSKMHRAGVTCTNCHEPHSATLRVEGDGLCTQCHSAAAFGGVEHHRHESAEVPACVDCHMPTATFMQVDPRRDHFIRVPRPSVEGAPNACLDCHGGRDTDWVRRTLDGWYGPARDSTRIRAAQALAAAEAGSASAVEILTRVVRDTAVSDLTRAAAMSYLERYPSQASAAVLAEAVDDGSYDVRAAAARGFSMVDPRGRIAVVAPLLRDPTRRVRLAAARVLAPSPRGSFTDEQLAVLDAASAELEQAQAINADDPAAAVELADFQAERGYLGEAEAGYRRAMRLEPGFVAAYLNLADLYRTLGRDASALGLLAEGRRAAPEDAMLAYAEGLAHVRADQLDEALVSLESAVRLDPTDARFVVGLALALEQAGRRDEALAALDAARPRVAEASRAVLDQVRSEIDR